MKYNDELLQKNLNNDIAYPDFFKAFGYTAKDTIFARTFSDKGKDSQGHNFSVDLWKFDSLVNTLSQENNQNRGVFFVVNGGGHKHGDVKIARACFIDMDEQTLPEQLKALCDFPLEPSIIIETRKSLHAYWLTPGGAIDKFRELQARFIQHFKSDPKIKEENRVMRLYGFNHCKQTPVEVKVIKFDPDITYTQEQLHEVLPRLEKPIKSNTPSRQKAKGEIISHGQRYDYVIRRIGYYVGKLPDVSEDIIFNAVYADFLENCEQIAEDSQEEFEKRFMPAIRKFIANDPRITDPNFYKNAMRAWREENPGKDFEECGANWDEVVEAGLRAQAADKTITEGLKQHLEEKAGEIPGLVSLDEVEEEPITWLIPGYIPKGAITLLAGEGGTGKGMTWTKLLADLSAGRKTFFEEEPPTDREPLTVLYLSSEDDTAKVVTRRFRKHGAVMSNVKTIPLSSKAFGKYKMKSTELEQLIKTLKPAICVLDPVQSFVSPTIKMGDRNAMRDECNSLLQLGAVYGTAFLIICHTNKRVEASGRNIIADSADLWDIARAVYITGYTDRNDMTQPRYISHEKTNYFELQKTVLYTIEDGVFVYKGRTNLKDYYYRKENRDNARELNSIKSGSQQEQIKQLIIETFEKEGRDKSYYSTEPEFNKLKALSDNDLIMDMNELHKIIKANGYTDASRDKTKQNMKADGLIEVVNYGQPGKPKHYFIVLKNGGTDPEQMTIDWNSEV